MLAAVLVLLFLAGSFASAYQAMRWIERRQRRFAHLSQHHPDLGGEVAVPGLVLAELAYEWRNRRWADRR